MTDCRESGRGSKIFLKVSAVCAVVIAGIAVVLIVAAMRSASDVDWYGTLRCLFTPDSKCYVVSDAVYADRLSKDNVDAWKAACKTYISELPSGIAGERCRYCMVTLDDAGALVYDLKTEQVIYRSVPISKEIRLIKAV